MDISKKLPPAEPHPGEKPAGKARAAPERTLVPFPEDRTHLSVQARQLKAAREAIRQMPEIDMNKVDDVKAKLKSGQYTVDSRKIASKLLHESLLTDAE